jgi:general secretion pathway protein L
MRIRDLPRRWVESLAGIVADFLSSRRMRNAILVTEEEGRFVARRARGGHDDVVAQTQAGTPLPMRSVQALRNHFVMFELAADKVVSRNLTVPVQAREFLAGIVGNQIERLSPWRPALALYGFDAQPQAVDDQTLDVRVFISSRAAIDAIRSRLAESGLAPNRICVRADEAQKSPLVTLWDRGAPKLDSKLQSLPAMIAAGIAAIVLLSAAVSVWAITSTNAVRAENDEVSTRAHVLQKQGQGSLQKQDLASLEPAQRAWVMKETQPAAVLVLEALTQALPDSAYVTELHLEDATVRVTGLAVDAPSLIAALEKSGRFSGVHFYAPTSKGKEGGAFYRFNIEGKVDPSIETVGD